MDQHPYHSRSNETVKSEKITISDLPLNFDNAEIENFLKSCPGIYLVSKIKFGNSRRPDGSFTHFLSGDRFCYAKGPIENPLPKTTKLGNFQCRLYHRNQKVTVCKICHKEGHKEGTEHCPAYKPMISESVIAFRSPMVFSNFYPCSIPYNSTVFSSVEQAFQYTKATVVQNKEIAEQILSTDDARSIKRIANNLGDDQAWSIVKEDVMTELISIKSENCPEFKTALIESEDKYLAEATGNSYWASGLSPPLTQCTEPKNYPGENRLGHILMKERNKLTNNVKFEKANAIQITKTETTHQPRSIIRNKQENEKRSSSLPVRFNKTPSNTANEVSPYFVTSGKRPSTISPNKEIDQKGKCAKISNNL
jgi:ribA/ribD-fused uncharacterized protein